MQVAVAQIVLNRRAIIIIIINGGVNQMLPCSDLVPVIRTQEGFKQHSCILRSLVCLSPSLKFLLLLAHLFCPTLHCCNILLFTYYCKSAISANWQQNLQLRAQEAIAIKILQEALKYKGAVMYSYCITIHLFNRCTVRSNIIGYRYVITKHYLYIMIRICAV